MPIWIRFTWPTVGPPIPEAAFAHLETYLTRYAQTLAVPLLTTEAATDGVIALIDLPQDRSVDEIATPLRDASARFLRSALGVARFAWSEEWSAESVSADLFDDEDDEEAVPRWLREALGESSTPEEAG